LLGEALPFNGKPPIEAVEAGLVVDDGPMTICEMVVGKTVVKGTMMAVDVLGTTPGGVETGTGEVFSVPTAVPVGIVTDGRPATVAHPVVNESMRLCASETTLTEGST